MKSKISNLMIMLVIGVGVFMGMFSFMTDLAYEGDGITPKFNLSIPTGVQGNITAIGSALNKTSNELRKALTSDQSWTVTTLNIFYNLPNTVMATLTTITSQGANMIGIVAGPDSTIPIPDWFVTMMLTILAIIAAAGIILLIFGRSF